jgi:antitoxin VapB
MVEIWCNIEPVALNIKNEEAERLAAEVARMTGETKTEAIRRALAERRQRLAYRLNPDDREARALRFLEREVWPRIPDDQLGRRLSREEEDEILGYGPAGT